MHSFCTFQSQVITCTKRNRKRIAIFVLASTVSLTLLAFRPPLLSFSANSAEPDPDSLEWTLIPFSKHEVPSWNLVEEENILKRDFVVVSTGIFDTKSELHYAREDSDQDNVYRFSFVPPSKNKKSRLELSTCFTKEDDIINKYGNIPAELSWVLKVSCPAAQLPLDHIHTYQYEIYVPQENFNSKGGYIITQWHGTVDPTFIQDEVGCIMQTTFEDLNNICKRKCRNGQILNKEFSGIRYNQGGHPPLSMYIDRGQFLIVARSDEKVFVRKESCNLNGSESSLCRDYPRQQNAVIYKAPIKDFNKWVAFVWKIKWSEYSVGGNNTYKNPGHRTSDAWIRVWMNDKKIVDWVGPCGKNDNGRTPYFKAGIYNPRRKKFPITLFFRRYRYMHESFDCHEDDEVKQMASRLKAFTSTEKIVTKESRCESSRQLSPGVWARPVRLL